jgi:hypothetical protein
VLSTILLLSILLADTLATFRVFGLISNQMADCTSGVNPLHVTAFGVAIGGAMSESHTPHQEERALEKALTNKIIDDCFAYSESWLRAILRMCIFSLGYLDGQAVFVVECPNQAVAKRLSRKTYPFRGMVYYLTDELNDSDRSLFCYKERTGGNWRCFDTSTNSWKTLSNLHTPIAPTDS